MPQHTLLPEDWKQESYEGRSRSDTLTQYLYACLRERTRKKSGHRALSGSTPQPDAKIAPVTALSRLPCIHVVAASSRTAVHIGTLTIEEAEFVLSLCKDAEFFSVRKAKKLKGRKVLVGSDEVLPSFSKPLRRSQKKKYNNLARKSGLSTKRKTCISLVFLPNVHLVQINYGDRTKEMLTAMLVPLFAGSLILS